MINWNLISYSIETYKAFGYRYVDVPWIVPNAVHRLVSDGPLSLPQTSEAGFTKLVFDGLTDGKYVTCTPVFSPDRISVQLYRTDQTDAAVLYDMIEDALNVFGIHSRSKVTRKITSDGISLMMGDHVIGRYGVRKIGHFSLVYGTGLDEPDFSQAI